jgi:hypothetical protein
MVRGPEFTTSTDATPMSTDFSRNSSRLSARMPVEYILPLRWSSDEGLSELVRYLRWVSTRVSVTVVDGSHQALFEAHRRAFPRRVRHVAPDPAISGLNGKVVGVLTGFGLARHDRVIIADDDVRYDETSLSQVNMALSQWDIVRPQNYFVDLAWHSRWDTARTLINRAFRSDFPGTLGLRLDTLPNGYSADVLFENLELIRTVLAGGGSELRANDIFVARLSPSSKHFFSQRVRQAYDSIAQPPRFIGELLLAPLLVWSAFRPRRLLWLLLGTFAVAQVGRVRNSGSTVFPLSTVFFAPLWLLERAICAWLAAGTAVRGGVRYNGRAIRTAAHSSSELRKRAAASTRNR